MTTILFQGCSRAERHNNEKWNVCFVFQNTMVKLRNVPQLNMITFTFYNTQLINLIFRSTIKVTIRAIRQANRQLIPEVSCEARSKVQTLHLGWWTHRWVVVSIFCYFHPYLGKWSNLTNIFQLGWIRHLNRWRCFFQSLREEIVWQEWLWYDWRLCQDMHIEM